MTVRLPDTAFDPGAELTAFLQGREAAGAAVTFTGLVRSDPHDPVTALELECYPELALNEIGALVDASVDRFGLIDALVIHRHGRMVPGDAIVQVMTLAPHRAAAFAGASFLMDHLKTDAPFWKRETTPSGTRWVAARAEDDAARARWR